MNSIKILKGAPLARLDVLKPAGCLYSFKVRFFIPYRGFGISLDRTCFALHVRAKPVTYSLKGA